MKDKHKYKNKNIQTNKNKQSETQYKQGIAKISSNHQLSVY